MRTISMRLPDDLLEELGRAAKARGVTKSRLVRESLEHTLRPRNGKNASCFDVASDLAGRIKGLPKDLASNPDYLEGFGR
jgi:predicted DNA-binding protein